MCWHSSGPDRWLREQVHASRLLHDFKAEIDWNQTAIIRGAFDVCSENGHIYESVGLRIEYPATFPVRNKPPSVYMESHRDRWTNNGDSHIEDNWRLCLFVPGESRIDFANEESLNELFAVVQTFLFKQRIYQRRLAQSYRTGEVAKWSGEERSHGDKGIQEAIRAKGGVGRNEPCPCGSGEKYKKCHLLKSSENYGL